MRLWSHPVDYWAREGGPAYRMRRLRACVTGLSLLVSVLVPTLAVAAEGFARKSVLLLYAESRIVPAVLRVDAGIRSRFTTAGVEAEFLPEYLDLSWAAEPGATADLLAFLRKDPPQRSSLDPNAVIQDVVLLVHSDTVMRRVDVVLDLAPGLPAVHADRIQLQQVVLNLIMNGLDAMRGVVGHPLGIATVLNQDGSLQVAVSDRGVGLPKGDEQRVFDAFYTTKAHGLGMGLSIVRSLIHAHDGQVWARNNEDGGATFTFTLPVEPAMRAVAE